MKSTVKKQFLATIIIVFCLLVFMVTYIFTSFYRTSVDDINEIGISNMKSEVAMIENYLNKSMDVLWVTADTVNYMMDKGASSDEILQYLTTEVEHETREIDENFTGIYGYIKGEYLDGIGWVPPEDYVPTEREWYVAAKKAGGKATIVQPYLDAQTKTIMFSVSQLLRDGESVVSLDVALNEVQSITEDMTLNDMGYGFVMDNTGFIVAHFDESEKGKVYPENEEQEQMLDRIINKGQERFTMDIEGEHCTVFSKKVMGDWFAVTIVRNTKLFYDLRMQMFVGIMLAVVVFLIIVVFCAISAARINKYQRQEQNNKEKLDKMNTNIIRALAYSIDAKDRYTSGHSQRVAEYSCNIAKMMGKSEEEQKIIYYAGLLHDVGKIRVPEEVINKPGKLTDEEFDQIRAHPVSGYHILKDIYEDERIADGVKYHHERYDGKGYPNGLKGENIPEIARIIGVADAYDAMASNRSYRDALPQEVVRSEIEQGRGCQFDSKIADIMLNMISEDREYSMCQSARNSRNVLVADEEKSVKQVEQILKTVPDLKVISLNSDDEIFDILDNQKIHLVLMDLNIEDTERFEICAKIMEKYSIVVVPMTMDNSVEMTKKLCGYGITDYLIKPLYEFVVRETVHGIVHGWEE